MRIIPVLSFSLIGTVAGTAWATPPVDAGEAYDDATVADAALAESAPPYDITLLPVGDHSPRITVLVREPATAGPPLPERGPRGPGLERPAAAHEDTSGGADPDAGCDDDAAPGADATSGRPRSRIEQYRASLDGGVIDAGATTQTPSFAKGVYALSSEDGAEDAGCSATGVREASVPQLALGALIGLVALRRRRSS